MSLSSDLSTIMDMPVFRAPVRKAKLLDNAVLLRLKFSRYGTSRKVATSQVEVNAPAPEPPLEKVAESIQEEVPSPALELTDNIDVSPEENAEVAPLSTETVLPASVDKRRLHITKQILTSPEVSAIGKLDRDITDWVKSQCLPSTIDDGLWFVPLANVQTVNIRLDEMDEERKTVIEKLCDALPALEEQDRAQLQGLYSPNDYPSPDALRRAFALDWYFLALTAPRSLEAVSEEMYMEAQRRMEQNIATATEAVQSVLRSQFKKLVDHMVERLTPEPDGRKRVFRDSLTSNFKEFLAKFSTMNITEDAELDTLVQQARGLMDGVEPDALRDLDDLRSTVLAGFDQIQTLTDQLIEEEPSRRILI